MTNDQFAVCVKCCKLFERRITQQLSHMTTRLSVARLAIHWESYRHIIDKISLWCRQWAGHVTAKFVLCKIHREIAGQVPWLLSTKYGQVSINCQVSTGRLQGQVEIQVQVSDVSLYWINSTTKWLVNRDYLTQMGLHLEHEAGIHYLVYCIIWHWHNTSVRMHQAA